MDCAKVCTGPLGLEEHDWLTVLEDRIINFLALLDTIVRGELGHDLARVKDIVSKRIDERHYQRSLCSFFSLAVFKLFRHAAGKLVNLVDEIHLSTLLLA